MKIVLASASPRRRELLKELVPDFRVLPAKGEERADPSLSPEETVKELARRKAEEVAALIQSQECAVLGADTVVALDGKILGKPKDEADAFRHAVGAVGADARGLYGRVSHSSGRGKTVRAERTEVEFYPLSEEWIREYIAGGSPMDKAGAYGIQDGGLARRITGSYSNVVGLPLELCRELLTPLLFGGR